LHASHIIAFIFKTTESLAQTRMGSVVSTYSIDIATDVMYSPVMGT